MKELFLEDQMIENSFMNYGIKIMIEIMPKILSKEKTTNTFIKQFKADHDSVQFYKNVVEWYVKTYNKFPDDLL